MARVHLAIVDPAAACALLSGDKHIESRFSRHRRAPYGQVARGDTIHFKLTGGRVIGTAAVAGVQEFHDLTPPMVERLRRLYNGAVRAPARYWASRRGSRYGVLIWLGALRPVRRRLRVPRQFGRAWVVLAQG